MNIIDRIKNKYYASVGRAITANDRGILDFFGIDEYNVPRKAISQTTYFIALKTLSEAMGKLPLKLYQQTKDGIKRPAMTDTLRLLSLQPNPYMTATTFWTLCEMLCQHYGNSYVWIDGEFKPSGRYGGKYEIKAFYPMHPQNVTILIDDAGLFGTAGCVYYQYTNPDTGEQVILRDSEVMHFKTWYTEDGLVGKSVRDILKATVEGAGAAADYENNLYKNGMTAKMIMQYSGNLDEDRAKEAQKKFADKLCGAQAAGKIIPIPTAFNLVPLNQSMVDADFATLRKYSALQIAAAFGIKPSQINDYEHSKYASSESEAIAFLTDTLAYRIKAYEEEINAKILMPSEYKKGYYYKFNEKALLRTDSKTQSEILKNYVQGGIYKPNEARAYLDKDNVEGGDTLYLNGSYVPITEAGAAYKKKTTTDNGGNVNEDD